MGAGAFIAKPFDAVETARGVRNLLKLRRLYRDVTTYNRLLEQAPTRRESGRRFAARQEHSTAATERA